MGPLSIKLWFLTINIIIGIVHNRLIVFNVNLNNVSYICSIVTFTFGFTIDLINYVRNNVTYQKMKINSPNQRTLYIY